jgi:hypothetical protein
VELTTEMQENMRAHYRAQGATEVDLIESESAAIVLVEQPATFLSILLGDKSASKTAVRWRRWELGNGFIAVCNRCHSRAEFEEVTEAGKKTLRFRHCGKADRIPLWLRLLY